MKRYKERREIKAINLTDDSIRIILAAINDTPYIAESVNLLSNPPKTQIKISLKAFSAKINEGEWIVFYGNGYEYFDIFTDEEFNKLYEEI